MKKCAWRRFLTVMRQKETDLAFFLRLATIAPEAPDTATRNAKKANTVMMITPDMALTALVPNFRNQAINSRIQARK